MIRNGEGLTSDGVSGNGEKQIHSFQNTVESVTEYSSTPLSVRGTSQDSQWMPKTSDSTEAYIYYI